MGVFRLHPKWWIIIVLLVASAAGIAFIAKYLSTPRILLTAPSWKVGDWFEIECSTRGIRNSDPEHPWRYFRRIYAVTGTAKKYGYDCFILAMTYEKGPSQSPFQDITISHPPLSALPDATRYYFRKSDMMLISIEEKTSDHYVRELCGLGPWFDLDCRGFSLFPRFPVHSGRTLFNDPFTDSKGNVVTENLKSSDNPAGVYQKANSVSIATPAAQYQAVHIEAGRYVCNWVPGQMWWAQCYMNQPKYTTNGYVYRAALKRTSRDGDLDYPLLEYRGWF